MPNPTLPPKKSSSAANMKAPPQATSAPTQQAINMMNANTVKARGENKWEIQRKKQAQAPITVYYPKIIFFGEKGVGKTHLGGSAFEQNGCNRRRNRQPGIPCQ